MTAPTTLNVWDFEHLLMDLYDIDILTIGQVIEWCRRRCREVGVPFEFVSVTQYNERRERVGPRQTLSMEAGDMVLELVEAMTKARDAAFGAKIAD